MKRKLWMQIHLYLSLFFTPLALIYAFTGVLYIFGLNQNAGAIITNITLESRPQKGQERDFILEILNQNNLKIPKDTSIKSLKGNIAMGDVKYSVALLMEKNGNLILRTTERNLYGVLMMMHKSGGKKYEIGDFRFSLFDFLAIGFGISMLLFYLSGLIMTSFCKGKRKAAFGVMGIGFLLTILAVYLSV